MLIGKALYRDDCNTPFQDKVAGAPCYIPNIGRSGCKLDSVNKSSVSLHKVEKTEHKGGKNT